MIKFAILGFLMDKNLTGYDIKQIMTRSTSNFMNASFGSIYPTLKKLEKDGLISSTKIIKNGKYNKVYQINEIGRKTFIKWLEEPIDSIKSYGDILIKIFFYENLPQEKACKLIEQLIENVDKKIEYLEKYEAEIKDKTEYFRISTLHIGIDYFKFIANWYRRFLEDLNN